MSNAAIVAFVVGLVVSIIAVIVSLKVDNHERAHAIIVGGIAIVLTTALAIGAELLDFEKEQRDVLEHSIPRIANRVWRDVVKDIQEYDQKLVQSGDPNIFEDRIHDRLRVEIAKSLQQAQEGNVVVRTLPETIEMTSRLIEQARESILATSYVSPDDWWEADVSRDYEEGGVRAKSKVQTFRRIFIVAANDDLKKLARVSTVQRNAGIDVMFVCADSLDPDERMDFIVIDSKAAAELELDSGRHFRQAHFYPTQTRSRDLGERFKLLALRATKDLGPKPCAKPQHRAGNGNGAGEAPEAVQVEKNSGKVDPVGGKGGHDADEMGNEGPKRRPRR